MRVNSINYTMVVCRDCIGNFSYETEVLKEVVGGESNMTVNA